MMQEQSWKCFITQRMLQTYISSSNNTRWGSLRLTSTMELLYWIIIIAIKLQYDELLRVRPQ